MIRDNFIPGVALGVVLGGLMCVAVLHIVYTPEPKPPVVVKEQDVKVRLIGEDCAAVFSYGPNFEGDVIPQ